MSEGNEIIQRKEGSTVRVRTNITARIPDAEGKFRDSFDRTVEIESSDYKDPATGITALIEESNKALESTFATIKNLGGKSYSIKKEIIQ